MGVTTGPLPPVAGLGCITEVRTAGTLGLTLDFQVTRILNMFYNCCVLHKNIQNVITDALGVGALLGGPPPMEFSFGLFGALAAPAFGLAFWLAVGGGTWPMIHDAPVER